MTRQESFHSLVHEYLGYARRLKTLATFQNSHDLWPPHDARRIARELRETADVIDEIAEREPR